MKKLLAFILSVCITAGLTANVYAESYGNQTFSDVPESHWAYQYISDMVERGILDGYDDGTFRPESQVTRAEFAKIMTTAAGLSYTTPTSQIFSDVSVGAWYAPYVHTAKDYLSGYNDGVGNYYNPNTPALREDIAVALVKLKGYSTNSILLQAVLLVFADRGSISEEAKVYVAAAIANGLISGYDDGTFRGQSTITRAEAATLLWRAYQQESSTAQTPQPTQTVVVTPAPTPKQEIVATPTPQPTEEIPQKPYTMRKLADADLESLSMATMDGDNNIYYIDVNDNWVYKIDTLTGKKSKYFDAGNLSYTKTEKQENDIVEEVTKIVETGEYEEVEEEITEIVIDEETGEETEITKTVTKKVPITKKVKDYNIKTVIEEVTVAEYTSFVPLQVFYDNVNDKLLLNGYYEKLVEAGKSPQSDKYHFIYDISERVDKVYCIPNWSYTKYYDLPLTVALNAECLVSSGSNYGYKIDVITGDTEKIWMDFWGNSGLKYGNNLYGLVDRIYQYDFNANGCEAITEYIDYDSFGIKGDCYYFWNSEGYAFKVSVRNKATTMLDINTLSENVEFEDFGNMRNIDKKFFVIDDNIFIFYDTNMKAFRILEKN